MNDLTEVLKPFESRIHQWHQTRDKFAATVTDDQTKTELVSALRSLSVQAFVGVAPSETSIETAPESTSDNVETLYTGFVDVRRMKPTGFGKTPNNQFFNSFAALFKAMPYFQPVILTRDLTVIDGELRIRAAVELGIQRLPAVVVNATQLQSKFLRLVLNKSNEFQRWHWDEIDDFLQENPNYLDKLERLAIFGERVVPRSYAAPSVTDYAVHDQSHTKTSQAAYKQEHGLAIWAKIMRAELAVKEEVRVARKSDG